jgi:tetratricopeptide (TPR) repeat protein
VSLLITPDRRRRLQQRYDEARQLANLPRPDFQRIHELLSDCLRADPENVLYLDALLANLKRRDRAGRGPGRLWTWLARWIRPRHRSFTAGDAVAAGRAGLAGGTEYSVLSTPYCLLQDAARRLWGEPGSLSLLRQLAAAAGECDCDEVELRYLAAARDVAPDDAETQRLVARALTRQGRFEDAVGPWCAVLALTAGDAEAEQAALDLRGVAAAEPVAPPANGDNSAAGEAQSLLVQARASQDAGRFDSAEHYFAEAQAALGGDLALVEERERSRLLRSEQRVQIARCRAEHDEHPRSQSLVARLQAEHNRLEIELLNVRAERLPTDAGVRLELGRRLKQAGNFSGAVQRLEEALRLAPSEATVLLELGESWQHLRQFAKALDYYQQAVAATVAMVGSAEESWLLARYRTAVLAAALGQSELARSQFAAIVTAQPAYKDAAQRLTALTL